MSVSPSVLPLTFPFFESPLLLYDGLLEYPQDDIRHWSAKNRSLIFRFPVMIQRCVERLQFTIWTSYRIIWPFFWNFLLDFFADVIFACSLVSPSWNLLHLSDDSSVRSALFSEKWPYEIGRDARSSAHSSVNSSIFSIPSLTTGPTNLKFDWMILDIGPHNHDDTSYKEHLKHKTKRVTKKTKDKESASK